LVVLLLLWIERGVLALANNADEQMGASSKGYDRIVGPTSSQLSLAWLSPFFDKRSFGSVP
jgi:hypothetical protein